MQDTDPIVFVVDDDVSVRESLEQLILKGGWKPELFGSAQEFLERPRTAAPSCLLLDVSLPGLDGFELQQQLSHRPDMPIIFISGHGDVPKTVRAMKAGALEFLTKPLDPHLIRHAIREAIERSRNALLVESDMRELRSHYQTLTPREREVMTLVVSGRLNKQIGATLRVTEFTVKAHRGQVMHKMRANSVAELVTMAERLGVRQQPRE